MKGYDIKSNQYLIYLYLSIIYTKSQSNTHLTNEEQNLYTLATEDPFVCNVRILPVDHINHNFHLGYLTNTPLVVHNGAVDLRPPKKTKIT